jgi:hypothetical protein
VAGHALELRRQCRWWSGLLGWVMMLV